MSEKKWKRVVKFKKPDKPARKFLIGAVDSETRGLDGDLVLTQVHHEYWPEPLVFPTFAWLLKQIFSMPEKILAISIWYSHNAEYDWRYMLPELKIYANQYGFELKERAVGKFYELTVVSKTELYRGRPKVITRFRDSMAFYEHSLRDFTEQYAPQYVKQDIGLGSGVLFDPKNPLHIEYAKNDVVGLIEAIKNFDIELYKTFEVHLGATASGTAYQSWLRTLDEDEYHDRQPKSVETFLRKCYNGGLVNVGAEFSREYSIVHVADINSSYPASMRGGVPMGRAKKTYYERPGYPAFYRTRATIPLEAIMPIVPFRDEKDRLAWARGEKFIAYLSSMEIEYCRTLGCEFEILDGYYFPDGLTLCFDRFVDKCEALRAIHKKDPTDIVVKRMQNSLYGRFGMKPEGREVEINFDYQPDDMEAVFDPDTGASVQDAYYRNVERNAEYMLPHYSAWITAKARINLDKATRINGAGNCLYRDTDSAHSSQPFNSEFLNLVGGKYGQFKLEANKFNVRYHAPKSYTYTDDHGLAQAVYKGIPRGLLKWSDDPAKREARNALIAQLHEGVDVEVVYHSSTSMQTLMRTGQMSIIRKRRPTNPEHIYGHVIENGIFRPRIVNGSGDGNDT